MSRMNGLSRATVMGAVLLAITATSAIAQNAPAAKPAEPKPSANAANAATAADAAKTAPAADQKKTAEAAKPAPAQKTPDGKPADPKAAAAAGTAEPPAEDKDRKKTAKADGPPCVVAEFRAIGMDVYDTTKRRTQAMNWLKKRAKNCSVDQLLMIRNNRSQWMGTADSAALATEVDSLLEAIAADNPQVATILYGTAPAPGGEGDGGKK